MRTCSETPRRNAIVMIMRNGLEAIGFEIEPEYFEIARKRLDHEADQLDEMETAQVSPE
jgi:DNA modification methylase